MGGVGGRRMLLGTGQSKNPVICKLFMVWLSIAFFGPKRAWQISKRDVGGGGDGGVKFWSLLKNFFWAFRPLRPLRALRDPFFGYSWKAIGSEKHEVVPPCSR